jgi:hypothetical protein
MKRLKRIVYLCGMVPLLGFALLAQPQPAEARVDVTVGLGVPAPVVVVPAPVVVVRRGPTATVISDTIIGDTTLGTPTGTHIGTGATIIITGTAGKADGRTEA